MARVLRALTLHTVHPREAHARGRTGWWAWALQRATGLLLVFYLFLHIAVISTAQGGEEAFDGTLAFVQHPFFAALNVALIAIVLYHAFNGIRVVLIDLGVGAGRQASMFWASVVLTGGGTGLAAYLSVPLVVR